MYPIYVFSVSMLTRNSISLSDRYTLSTAAVGSSDQDLTSLGLSGSIDASSFSNVANLL